MTSRPDRTAVLALGWLAGVGGHYTGDFWSQRDCDAQRKQQRTAAGRRALGRHALSYAVTVASTRAAAYRVAGVRVPWRAQVVGGLVDGLLHLVIDDGRLLRWCAYRLRKQRFYHLAEAGVNGQAQLDQAAHLGLQVPLGAAATALMAAVAR